MVKTHPDSRFALYTLDQIRDSAAIVLQIEKTDSTFTESKKSCYLCEIVLSACYNRKDSIERLTDEIVRANTENRRLHGKIDRLEKALSQNVR
ncbi:hypothetical protein [Clostridium sp. KNHs216]|uniref:hypothetical protein n=1 Tax=Clostridium sp. KNHs216 TaxID=1550235 RepID=UPI00116FAE26|nr:hypothetical protein [Clostridium sp. KNHs216]TQI68977.1 hypothetical protein LY85_3725 [Clostridium sp. KNHs216]